jgi:hypothetical protein
MERTDLVADNLQILTMAMSHQPTELGIGAGENRTVSALIVTGSEFKKWNQEDAKKVKANPNGLILIFACEMYSIRKGRPNIAVIVTYEDYRIFHILFFFCRPFRLGLSFIVVVIVAQVESDGQCEKLGWECDRQILPVADSIHSNSWRTP